MKKPTTPTRIPVYDERGREVGWLQYIARSGNFHAFDMANQWRGCSPDQAEAEEIVLGRVDASNHPDEQRG